MTDFSPIAGKLAALLPRLASDHDGEVVATARALCRLLERQGLTLHDLAAAATAEADNLPADPRPADFAEACLRSGHLWKLHELDFLKNVMCFGSSWAALSDRQAKWLRDLHQKAHCAAEAA